MRLLLLLFSALPLCRCYATEADTAFAIIPRPVHLQHRPGFFHLTAHTRIFVDSTASIQDARIFNEMLKQEASLELKITRNKSDSDVIRLTAMPPGDAHTDEYHLTVTPHLITVQGAGSGTAYGLTTLIQMMDHTSTHDQLIPCAFIDDYPRFAWRGMHLDCSRHFFSKEFVMQYIDYLARYKFNTFHWHLTDDQGWRIEIKKYPLLTQVGAWRSGTMTGPYRNHTFDSIRYGGYYTQQDIREVVAYAQARHINVVPEIEMPGHSLAALAAYPQYACTGGPFEVGEAWGGYDDVFCPTEATFTFLKDVLSEVCDLFPSRYIHVGGDEVSKTRWKACAHCQELIAKFNLGNEEGLQAYFMSRIDSFLTSRGRQLVGWDEILEGGLSANAVVMSWRGTDGGIAAAQQQHDVVMCPGSPCYFDHYQSTNSSEPLAIGGYNPIQDVYAYDPVPATLNAQQEKYILGAQGNLWTEYIATPSQVQYMIFPRMCALSEVLWTPPEEKSFFDFASRLARHFQCFDAQHINYSKAIYDVQVKLLPDSSHRQVLVKMSTLLPDVTIQYDDNHSAATGFISYSHSIPVNATTTFTANTYRDGQPLGRPVTLQVAFNKATGKVITLANAPSPRYNSGGAFTLVDGKTGLLPWRGSEWLGFSGSNLVATIDLGMKTRFSSVTVDVLEERTSWIHLPETIIISASHDGKKFHLLKTVDSAGIAQAQRLVRVNFKKTHARYVKVAAINAGTIPDGDPGAGHEAWLFVDEIGVE